MEYIVVTTWWGAEGLMHKAHPTLTNGQSLKLSPHVVYAGWVSELLNHYGQDGWDLVRIIDFEEKTGDFSPQCIFKRPRKEAPDET